MCKVFTVSAPFGSGSVPEILNYCLIIDIKGFECRRTEKEAPWNNPDWTRHKTCANSFLVWLMYFPGILKCGRQFHGPKETEWEINGTLGQHSALK